MANTDINPAVVAEVASDVGSTLKHINDEFNHIQDALTQIKDAWYNENALKIMPGATSSLTSMSKGINESLASLGTALSNAAEAWAEANGAAGGYGVGTIASEPKTMSCDVSDNKNGFKGMDVSDIQSAVDKLGTTQSEIIQSLEKLHNAGNKTGFRGGNMQASLQNTCDELKNQINSAINNIISDITSNTGTAAKNVENAKSTTESTFQIK